MKVRVVHIITGLNTGGAQMMLYKLIKTMDSSVFENIVISLGCEGDIGKSIVEEGVKVYSLHMSSTRINFIKLIHFYKLLKVLNPDVVQTWLYHADLIGGLIAKIACDSSIFWNIRHSNLDISYNNRFTLYIVKICSLLSFYLPDLVLSNSRVSADRHIKYGYSNDKFRIIPNGFDTSLFSRSQSLSNEMKSELNIPEGAFIFGYVARYDLQKNHEGFIRSAASICKSYDCVTFILCGTGIDDSNNELLCMLKKWDVVSHFRLLGNRTDLVKVNSSFDVSVLFSHGEGFPNAIGEAMSCGVPCIVSDVGDSAFLVDSTGLVVKPNDIAQLTLSMEKMLLMPRTDLDLLGTQARARIIQEFSLKSISQKYENIYLEAVI